MVELLGWLAVWRINFFILSATKLIRCSHSGSTKSQHLCNFLKSLDFLFSGTFSAAQCHSHFVQRLWQPEYIFSHEQTALSCSFPRCEADITQIKMCLKSVLEVLHLWTDLSATHCSFTTNKKGGNSSTFPVYTSHNWTTTGESMGVPLQLNNHRIQLLKSFSANSRVCRVVNIEMAEILMQ